MKDVERYVNWDYLESVIGSNDRYITSSYSSYKSLTLLMSWLLLRTITLVTFLGRFRSVQSWKFFFNVRTFEVHLLFRPFDTSLERVHAILENTRILFVSGNSIDYIDRIIIIQIEFSFPSRNGFIIFMSHIRRRIVCVIFSMLIH